MIIPAKQDGCVATLEVTLLIKGNTVETLSSFQVERCPRLGALNHTESEIHQ